MGYVNTEIEYICPQCGEIVTDFRTIDVSEIGNELLLPIQYCDSQECFLSGQSHNEMVISYVKIPVVDNYRILLF